MAFRYQCPHCSGQFHVDERPATGQAACPQCGQLLVLPAASAGSAPRAATGDPLDFLKIDAGKSRTVVKKPADPTPSADVTVPSPGRKLSREQRERRRMIRSIVMMIGGLVILGIAAAVLSNW